jgi:hypothetical protein
LALFLTPTFPRKKNVSFETKQGEKKNFSIEIDGPFVCNSCGYVGPNPNIMFHTFHDELYLSFVFLEPLISTEKANKMIQGIGENMKLWIQTVETKNENVFFNKQNFNFFKKIKIKKENKIFSQQSTKS